MYNVSLKVEMIYKNNFSGILCNKMSSFCPHIKKYTKWEHNKYDWYFFYSKFIRKLCSFNNQKKKTTQQKQTESSKIDAESRDIVK